jgi:hypothetical protein
VSYKRVDLSIKTALTLKRTLVVVGDGQERKKLHRLAQQAGLIRKKTESLGQLFNRADQEKKTIRY